MERWIIYAFISMCFAGFTAVIAKQGLVGISAELGLTLRTLFVCVFIILFGLMTIAPIEVKSLQKANYLWLSLSAANDRWLLDILLQSAKNGRCSDCCTHR